MQNVGLKAEKKCQTYSKNTFPGVVFYARYDFDIDFAQKYAT